MSVAKLPHRTIEILVVITARVTWHRSVAHPNHQLYSCRHVRDVPGEARTKALDESEGASRRSYVVDCSGECRVLLYFMLVVETKLDGILLGTGCEGKFYIVVG